MRIINIDLSQDTRCPQKVFGGNAREHNESKLVVKLPERMLRNDISYYYFEFQTVLGEHIVSPNIDKNRLLDGNKISVLLWEQLLPFAGDLNFCVSAVNLAEDSTITIKGKTSIFTLQILKSPTGEDALIDVSSTKEDLQKAIDDGINEAAASLQEDIAANVALIQKEIDDRKSADTALQTNIDKKVDKEDGKGLSTNDFTNEDKEKLYSALQNENIDQTYNPTSENAQSGKAVAEAINNIKVNQNLINMNEGEIGFITVNGTVQHPIGKYNAEAEKTSGFISVEKGQKYTLQAWVETGSAGMWIAYAFYDSDKTFISRSTSTTVNEINNNISHSSVTFTVPENAAFVRISGRTYNNGEFKLEKGEAATPYVANFQEKIDKLDVEKSIPLTYTTIIPSIYTNELPSIDTKAKTLYIPADTLLIDKRLNGTVSLEKQTFSFTASSSAVCILYDIKNSTLYSAIYSQCAALNPNNYLLLFAIRTDVYNLGYGKVSSTCPVIVDGRLYGVIDIESANSNSNDNNPYIHSINHRGYNTVAPENTLSAFKLSKKNGFDYVETDISFTSDNIPVLLHDSTIDRTSNGSGNISEMTFEQVRTYDFGSWKNSVYAGEKIPSFEEFCKLCKQIGLKPYVELKTVPTNEQLTTLLNNAKRYGILNDITWISFVSSALEKVLTSLPKARVGIITSGLTQTTINWVKSKKTDANDVFIDENISSLSSDNVQLCIADNIPLEVWTVNTSAGIQSADSYITGFTSDNLIANKQLFDTIV